MKTTMLDILKERLEEEEIIKLVSNYDNKFCELEEENKRLNKEIQRLNNIIELATYYIDNYMYENYAYCGSEDRLKQILSGNNFILKQLKELKGSDK